MYNLEDDREQHERRVHRRRHVEYRPRKSSRSHSRSSREIPMDVFSISETDLNDLEELGLDMPLLSSSLQSLSETNELDDSFQREVAKKTQKYFVGRQEAEVEVHVDRLVRQEGSKDRALLYVVSKLDNENKVQILVNTLLHRGAHPSTSDGQLKTPLHYAVAKSFKGVCNKLLENDAFPSTRDRENKMPFTIAYDKGNDDIACMLITYMSNIE